MDCNGDSIGPNEKWRKAQFLMSRANTLIVTGSIFNFIGKIKDLLKSTIDKFGQWISNFRNIGKIKGPLKQFVPPVLAGILATLIFSPYVQIPLEIWIVGVVISILYLSILCIVKRHLSEFGFSCMKNYAAALVPAFIFGLTSLIDVFGIYAPVVAIALIVICGVVYYIVCVSLFGK